MHPVFVVKEKGYRINHILQNFRYTTKLSDYSANFQIIVLFFQLFFKGFSSCFQDFDSGISFIV